MALISRTSYSANTLADANAVNTNENAIVNEINGNLDNANIKSSAAIVDTKLAQITTASKVATSALTGTYSNIVSTTITATNISATTVLGDWATVTWSDYSASSTIIGWASFTSKLIYIKKIGRTVFVSFYLAGTSNSTATNFTISSANNSSILIFGTLGETYDNSSYPAANGKFLLNTSSSTVVVYKANEASSGDWTSTGSKSITGQFFYETTA